MKATIFFLQGILNSTHICILNYSTQKFWIMQEELKIKKRKVGESLSLLWLLYQNTIDQMTYKQPKFISYSCRGWKSEIRMPTWLSSIKNSLLGCRLQTFLCIPTWQKTETGRKLSQNSYECTNATHNGPTLMTSSNHNYLPNTITLVEFQHRNFGWTQGEKF